MHIIKKIINSACLHFISQALCLSFISASTDTNTPTYYPAPTEKSETIIAQLTSKNALSADLTIGSATSKDDLKNHIVKTMAEHTQTILNTTIANNSANVNTTAQDPSSKPLKKLTPDAVDLTSVKKANTQLEEKHKALTNKINDIDAKQKAADEIQKQSPTSPEKQAAIKKNIDSTKNQSTSAADIFANALNSIGQFLEHLGTIIADTFEIIGKIIGIIFQKIGQEIAKIAEEIGAIFAKAAEEIYKGLVEFGKDLEIAAQAIANFFSNVGKAIESLFVTPKYYFNGIRVPKEVYDAGNIWNAKYTIFSKVRLLYADLQKICSPDNAFAYNINIVRVQRILTGTRTTDLPALFTLISENGIERARQDSVSAIADQSQKLQSQGAKINTITTPSPIGSITIQQLQSDFGLSDALTFLEKFKQDLYYDDIALLFTPTNFKGSTVISVINRWGNVPFTLGTAQTLQTYPTASAWKQPTEKNVIDWVFINKDTFAGISKNVDAHFKKLREINAKIDQYQAMALKKQYINKQFAWLSMIKNNIQGLLFTSEQTKAKNKILIAQGKQPDNTGLLSGSIEKIVNKTYADLTTGFANLSNQPAGIENSINWLYDDIMKLSNGISPFILHIIDINFMQQKKKAGIDGQSRLEKLIKDPASTPLTLRTDPRMRFLNTHSSWKPNLQIALDLFDYMNNTLLNDATLSARAAIVLGKDPKTFSLSSATLSDAEEQKIIPIMNDIISEVGQIQSIINLIISNEMLFAAAFGYNNVATQLFAFNPDLNTPLIVSNTAIATPTTTSAGSSIASQPYDLKIFSDSAKGLDNAKNLLMYQNWMLQLYGHTPLTAALASSNTPPATTTATTKIVNPKPALNCVQDMLHYAASISQNYIKPIILQAGATSPFYPNGNPSMVELLLQNGSRTDISTLCTIFGNDTSQVAKFIQASSTTQSTNIPLFATPLQWAVGMHNPDTALLLLNYGASLSDIQGVKPLITILDPQFLQPHYPQLIQAIINRGADDLTEALISIFDPQFLQTNFNVHKDIIIPIIILLIKSGASKNPLDSKGVPVPLIATIVDHVTNGKLNIQDAFNLIAILISEGINCNIPDSKGITALMKASENGYAQDINSNGEPTNIVQLLIQSGAGTSTLDTQGKNALDHALAGKNLFVIPFLAQGNCPLTAQARLELNNLLIQTTKACKTSVITDKNFKLFLMLLNVSYIDDKTPLTASAAHTLAGPNAVDKDPNKTSPLMYAVKNNNDTVVRLLLEAGANPTYQDVSGKTAADFAVTGSSTALLLKTQLNSIKSLFDAVEKNNISAIEAAIQNDTCINSTNQDGLSPLMLALKINNKQIVETFLHVGANLNTCDKNGKTPLMYAIDTADATIVEEIVETYPSGLYQKDTQGIDALAYAHTKNNQTIITQLTTLDATLQKAKTSTNTQLIDEYNATLSFYVTPQDNTHLASLSSQTNTNVTDLLAAAQSNDLVKIKKLVLAINDISLRTTFVNSVDSNNNTALLWASMNNNLDMVTFLVEQKANITFQNKTTNDQALTIAMRNNDKGMPIIKYLMKQLEIKKSYSNPLKQGTFDVDNTSPLLIAASNGMTDIAQLLFKNATERNQQDNLGNNVAVYASMNSNIGLLQKIETILSDASKTNALFSQQNNLGFTPLGYALYNNNIDLVTYLISKGVAIDTLSAIIFLTELNAVAPQIVIEFADALNNGMPLDNTGVTAALNKSIAPKSVGRWTDALVQNYLDLLGSMSGYTPSQKLFNALDANVQQVLTAEGIAPDATVVSYRFTPFGTQQPLVRKNLLHEIVRIKA